MHRDQEALEQFLNGSYQLLHVLGSGSNGDVYRAVQRSTGQSVALKFLLLDGLTEDICARRRERFRREIAFCSTLYHPEIVRLVDSGQLNATTHFAAFEYIPGTTLADLIRNEGMLRVRRALDLVCQLLPALAYAHGAGIAHRDLKPTNIMVATDGIRDRVKILDFGISIATDQEPGWQRLTSTTEWVGTPCYASPEQLRGQASGAKSDLYAWGLVAVECLTGRPVISGRSLPEIIEAQLRPTPHDLGEPLTSHRLGALLARVLDKDPGRRLGDANQLLALIERIPCDDLEDTQGYLRSTASGPASRPPAPIFDTVTDGRKLDVFERRHASVLCFRIFFSGPGVSSHVEQLDNLLDDAHAVAREALGQFGAVCAERLGGYSIAYFGIPRAQDTDTRMAVRAAMELVNRVEAMPHAPRTREIALRVRVGIHNGPVTVQITGGARRIVDGSTASLATNLASYPVPGRPDAPRILASEFFQHLAMRHAEFRPFAAEIPATVPWQPNPVLLYELRGESSSALALERSPFVGRERELDTLKQAYETSRAGTGQVLLLTGEPGIGKSRLTLELIDWLVSSKVTRCLQVRCSPEWQNASLRPLAELLTRYLGITDDLPPGAAACLEQKLQELALPLAEAVPLLGVWLSLPLPAGYAPLPWSPQKQRAMLYQQLVATLLACMERGAILVVEDIHWADPSTLECLALLFAAAQQRLAFVVMTARPGFCFNGSDAPRELRLGRLDDAAVERIACVSVAQPELAEIVARSDGVPLYAEELAFALRGQLQSTHAATPSHPPSMTSRLAVPATLRDLLFSRLDEVGDAKATAQLGAALGREFSLKALVHMSNSDDLSLLGDLEDLVSHGLLVKQLRVEGPVYMFRHALIRDSAYDSMAIEERKRIHERIALTLERDATQQSSTTPDILAHHFEAAGLAPSAVRYWLEAATRASASSAHLEALTQLDRAFALLPQLSEESERAAREVEILLARGAALVAKRGYADPQTIQMFERATALTPIDGPAARLGFAARWGLWYAANTTARLQEAWDLASQLHSIAQHAANSSLSLSALEARCETAFCRGDLAQAVAASRSCEELYDFDQHRQLAVVYGDDPHVATLSFEALAELLLGHPELALARAQQGIQHAKRLGFPHLLSGMYAQAAWVSLVWGSSGASAPDLSLAREHADQAILLGREHGFLFWEIYGQIVDASARIAQGDASAVGELRAGSDMWRMAGAALGRCWQLTYLARGEWLSGDCAAAHAHLVEAVDFCSDSGSLYFKAEVHRTRAELRLDCRAVRDVLGAEADLKTAAQAARIIGSAWQALSVCLTRLREPELATRQDLEELELCLQQIPRSSREPPLVIEAKALLAARANRDAGTALAL